MTTTTKLRTVTLTDRPPPGRADLAAIGDRPAP
jgi:hypothetical protein